jgi:hypothetical protein
MPHILQSFLAQNTTLPGNDYLSSAPSGAYFLAVSTGGDLCVFHRPTGAVSPSLLWRTQYVGANHTPAGSFVSMQTDGNLCWYLGSPSAQGGGIWCTSTQALAPAPPAPAPTTTHPIGMRKDANKATPAPTPNFAIMQDDGNFAIYSGTASNTPNGANTPAVTFLWGTLQHPVPTGGTWSAPQALNRGSSLVAGQYLNVNEYLVSPSGNYYAIVQPDGNFCVYHGSGPGGNPGKAALWALNQSQPAGSFYLTLDSNSMLSLYAGTGPTSPRIWQDGSHYKSNPAMQTGMIHNYFNPDVVYAVLQDNGDLVIYHGDPGTDDTICLWSWQAAAAGSSNSPSPGGAAGAAFLQGVVAMFPAYTLP